MIYLYFILSLLTLLLYLFICAVISDAAENKGRNQLFYFLLAFIFTPLLAGFVVLFLVPNEKAYFNNEIKVIIAKEKAQKYIEKEKAKKQKENKGNDIAAGESSPKEQSDSDSNKQQYEEYKHERRKMRDRL